MLSKQQSTTVFSNEGGHFIVTAETSEEALRRHDLAASRPGTLMFYTDGSGYGGHLGAGVFCPDLQLRASFIMGDEAGLSGNAEIYAIIEAVKAATARPPGSFEAVVICSDAQSAVRASLIRHPPKTQRFALALRWAVAEFNKRHSATLTLQWLKKDSVEANTVADQLARIGAA